MRRYARVAFKIFNRAGAWVQPIKSTAPGAEPDKAPRIFGNSQYRIAADTAGISRVVPVVMKLTCNGIETIEAAAVGADPDHTLAVFMNMRHSAGWKLEWIVRG